MNAARHLARSSAWSRSGHRRGLVLAVLALSLMGCGGAESEPGAQPSRVLVVGVEALSWERIDPLLEAGDLPNLARLVRGGVRARALARDPLEPLALWSTALTGKTRAQHRMMGGLVGLPSGKRSLAPSSMRQTRSILQIAGEEAGLVASVGMPGTYPAEVVNGFLVADGYTPNRWTAAAEHTFRREPGEMTTWPPALWAEIEPLVVGVDQLKREEVSRFFTLNETEYEMLYDRPLGSLLQRENPLRDFAVTHQSDRSNVAVARYLMRTYRPRLTLVHFALPSSLQPTYWAFSRPDVYRVPEDGRRRFRNAVDEGYRFVDAQIGLLMNELPKDGAVILVSDHGFHDGLDPRALADGETQPMPMPSNEAVLILYGQGLAAGVDLGRVQLADLTPTVLTLLGAKVGADMEGNVLERAFADAFRRENPVGVVESHDLGWDPATRYPQPPGAGSDEQGPSGAALGQQPGADAPDEGPSP